MGFQFPDAAMSGKPMKASYINDLRAKINIARQQQGQTPINWGPNLTSSDVIRASHINDLRSATRNLWLSKDMINSASEFPAYTEEEPIVLSAMYAGQITDNRTWLNEEQSVPTLQGISSYAYNPLESGLHVTKAWADDLRSLHDSDENRRIAVVRCTIRKDASEEPDDFDRTKIVADLTKYKNVWNEPPYNNKPNIRVFALLHKETFNNSTDPLAQNEELSETPPFSNTYIDAFSERMADLIKFLHESSAGVSDFIIWNEPNNFEQDNKKMEADRFAALLRRMWSAVQNSTIGHKLNTDPPEIRIFWGGILFIGIPGNETRDFYPSSMEYINSVYDSVAYQKSHTPNESYGGSRVWPWHVVNVQCHGQKEELFTNKLFSELRTAMAGKVQNGTTTRGDTSDILVGEWGLPLTGSEADNFPTTLSDQLVPTFKAFRRNRPTVMFYWTHNLDIDRSTEPDSYWGVRRSGRKPDGAYFPCEVSAPYSLEPGCDNKPGRLDGLYDAFQAALDLAITDNG